MSVKNTAPRSSRSSSRRPAGGTRYGGPVSMTHPPTSTNVAADTADERVGSAYKAVGSSLGAAARGVGSLFRRDKGQPDDDPSASTSRSRRPRSDSDWDDDFDPVDDDDEQTGRRGRSRRVQRPRSEGPSTFESHADAWGLILIGLAAVIGGSVWFNVAGPVGDLISTGTHWMIGAGALILPVVLVGIAVALMLNVRATDEARGRVMLGFSIIAVAMLGLIHVFAGNPTAWAERKLAGGAIGALTGGVLAAGFSSYVAVPLLGLVILYGALKATGITVRDAYDYIKNLVSEMLSNTDTPDDEDHEDTDPYSHVSGDLDDIAAGRERRSTGSRRSDASAPSRPTRTRSRRRPTPMESYPADGDDDFDLFDFADEVDEDDDAQDADDSQAADKTAVVSRRAPARKQSSTPSAPKPTPGAKPAPAPAPAAPVSPQADNETKELSRAEPEGERREASAPDAVASLPLIHI